jgi:hypothetical protein
MDGCEIKMGRESGVRCRAMLEDKPKRAEKRHKKKRG